MNIRTLLYSFFGLLGVFIALFLWSTYRYYTVVHADDPGEPLLEATLGMSKIIRGDFTYELFEMEEYELENNDIIETGIESRATITWPDKSITRLGPKTRIVIEKTYASRGYDHIEIAYSLERGKVWNTLIRSLVGDSYFEVHLPKESIVAGVRGTTFEINLDNRYIRAVQHSTLLSQNNQSVALFPGEMVDSENILIKKGKEWLDTKWDEWNTAADLIHESLMKLEIEKKIALLTKDIGKINISNLSRNILDSLPGFEDIRIAEYLESNRIDELKKLSSESLLSYYQKLGNIGNIDMKEALRSELLSKENPSIAKFRESIELHALWDSLDTGRFTLATRKFLESKGVNIDDFQKKFLEGAKNDIQNFGEIFSGGLLNIIKL